MALRTNTEFRDRAVAFLARLIDRLTRRTSRAATVEPGSVKRILMVKPCCFGDVMMATPAIRSLRQAFPDAKVDVLTTEWCAEALRNNPGVDGVYRYPATMSFVPFFRLLQRIKGRHYDLAIGLDRSPIVNLLLLLSSVPERAGIDSGGRGIGLTHRTRPQPNQHETDLYLSVVESVGATRQEQSPDYCPPQDARESADELLSELNEPIVVIHPGGAVNPDSTMLTKRWPALRFGELASELVERHQASIVVVGAESDADAVQGTIDFTDAKVTDLSARLSIPELAAVCERAQLYIGNDSGMSHLASAVGTPTVTIFGPTDPDMYRPLGPHALVCSPARRFKLPWRTRDLRRKHAALPPGTDIGQVTVDEVLEACEKLLADGHNLGTS